MIDHSDDNGNRRTQLSSLHKNIRMNKWNEVQLILENDSTCLFSLEDECLNQKLIFTPNSVGWTAIHFTILHCESSSKLRWMISRVLEEYHSSHSLRYQEAKDDVYSFSPFFTQTNSGYTSTDLFFAKRLFPFPFETNDVHEDASRLLKTIQFILRECQVDREFDHFNANMEGSESPIIKDIRHRIWMKRKYSCHNDNRSSGLSPQPQSQSYSNHNELDELMTNFEHYNEAIFYSNHYLEGLKHLVDEGIENEDVEELADFWYDLELILMAAVHETIYTECNFKTDTVQTVLMTKSFADNARLQQKRKWSTIHALAKTGCPHEISQLAILLYPEQVVEQDEHGNLPLHIACSSHSSSSYTEGDDLSYKLKRWTNKKDEQKQLHCCAPMIKTLLNVYPHATTLQNANDQLPITLALRSGKNWYSGIYHIFQSNPSMILTGISRDKPTNLHSFMIAASSNHSNESTSAKDEHRLTQRIISKKNIGLMCRSFKNSEARQKAEKEAENELDRMRLTTILELLKIYPGACKKHHEST
jgi:hypothetical protein